MLTLPFDLLTSILVPEPPCALSPRRAADVLVDILIQQGVEVVFGLPGGTIAPLFDALLDRHEIQVVTTKHESSAMFAAAGYAQTSGKLGVVMVTSGPGALNAMTGLASAFCDGLPVMLIAGEVSRKSYGKGALQEGSPYHLDIIGMTRRITKASVEIHEPGAAPTMLRRAIATALSGRRGPVAVTLPVDVASAMIQESYISSGVSTTFTVDPIAVQRAARSIRNAVAPVIFAGSGVRFGNGPARLLEFAEKTQCPVMTTPKGKGVFPEGHHLALGVFGIGGHPSATRYLEDGIDVMLAIGTSLGDVATNGWSPSLKPSGEFIHVDIDSNQIGRNYAPTLSVSAPAEVFLAQMSARCESAKDPFILGVEYHTDAEQSVEGTEGKITPQRAIWELQQVVPDDAIFTCDAGEHFVFATHYLRINHPDSFLVMTGLGSMGQSIGAVMGAVLARPDRTGVAICGDGCFAMNCTEIATAVEAKLPIVIMVLNDQRLGMVELGNSAIFGRTPAYPNAIDVPALARALGAETMVVSHAGEILAADLEREGKGPLVLDVRIDRSVRMPKNGRFDALAIAQGRRITEKTQ